MVGGRGILFSQSLTFLLLFLSSSFSYLSNTEQYTKEQVQRVAILEEISDLDTNALQSTEEAFQSKDSISLSLVGEASELIGQDFVPEEVTLDVAIEGDRKIEEKAYSNEFVAGKMKFTFFLQISILFL